MSGSGRKERVMIACVTFEVAKIVEPAVHYEATEIHLIHFGDKPPYSDFYTEVCNRIGESLPSSKIVEHIEPVYDFNRMMSTVLTVIQKVRKGHGDSADIYVNVSAGTSEYSAASLMASMMMDGVIPFNVPAERFQVEGPMVKDVYYDGDRPVGLTKKCREPVRLSTYMIKRPDEKLVLALRILKDHIDNGISTAAPAMIKDLSEHGLMTYETVGGRSSRPDQKSIMSYQRNFMEHWIRNGWVKKESKRVNRITSDGDVILETFCEGYLISRA